MKPEEEGGILTLFKTALPKYMLSSEMTLQSLRAGEIHPRKRYDNPCKNTGSCFLSRITNKHLPFIYIPTLNNYLPYTFQCLVSTLCVPRVQKCTFTLQCSTGMYMQYRNKHFNLELKVAYIDISQLIRANIQNGSKITINGLWNPEVECRIHKGFPTFTILSWINPIICIETYLFKIHSNIVLPSTLRPP